MTERILDEPRLRGGSKELWDCWIYLLARDSYEAVPSEVHSSLTIHRFPNY